MAWESISNNVPTNLLNQSVSKESAITKQLYNDYSAFKRGLFDNLVELNPQHDKLELFKKTQKLLDRFLFIFFAEDRLLLPTNLIRRINKEWENLQKMRMAVSLYDRYVVYFHDLNSGAKVTLPAFGSKTGEAIEETHEIFAYNGGLFKPDEFLDNLKINDQLLFSYTHKLSDYDFQSEVDVNILGHIFENSLNEIDEIKSEIEGNTIDKSKTRRKKDGVFYTPKYITKYIVDNTIGKLCTEKKEEIKLLDEDYTSTSSSYQKKTKKALLDKLADYRNWLLDLTICDPACGSGAFLNQALEFLIAEHSYVDELQAKLMGDAMILSDIENSILERNIYGVDLNDESVEIAKLSLWLRTAQKGRKLNSLNDNIKCGNSLIDDVAVAGDKAFSWEKEFPDVFAKGGFDVIIGNPPYVSFQNIEEKQKLFLVHNYISASGKFDLYVVFVEFGIKILKKGGAISYIMPNKFLVSNYGEGLKKILLEKQISKIIDFKDRQLFQVATTYPCIIIIYNNFANDNFEYIDVSKAGNEIQGDVFKITQNSLSINGWHLGSKIENNILEKLKKLKPLKHYSIAITQGIRTGKLDVFFTSLTKQQVEINKLEKKLLFKTFTGRNVKKYYTTVSENDLLLFPYINEKPIIIEDYPNVLKYLNQYKEDLLLRKDSGKIFRDVNKKWFEFWDPKFITFSKSKIVFPDISSENNFYLDEEGLPFINTCYSIFLKDETKYFEVITILNSKLFQFYIKKVAPSVSGGYFRYKTGYVEKFGIKFFEKFDLKSYHKMVELNSEFQIINLKFTTYFSNQYNLEKLSNKLEKWYSLEFVDFIKELNKAIKTIKGTPLTKKDEFEWIDLFEENKQKALSLKAEIDKTDKEIDKMVYALYELTEEEIQIVEGSVK